LLPGCAQEIDLSNKSVSGFNKAHELRKLHKREIEAFLSDPHKKGPELREAYEIAREPREWNDEQNRVVKKEEARGADEEDMLAEDDDEEDDKPTKKRKSASAQSSSKKVKTSNGAGAKKAKPQVKPTSAGSGARKSAGAEDGEGDEESKY
jgi:hypothetical protein